MVDAPVVRRLDRVNNLRLSRSLEICRLPIAEVVRLQRGNKVTILVTASPPTSRANRVSASMNAKCALLGGFGRVVVASSPCPLTSRGDRNLHIDRDFGERTVNQAGKPFFKFNVRVSNYPK